MNMHSVHNPKTAQPCRIRRATLGDLDEIVALWFQSQVQAWEQTGSLSIYDVKNFYSPFLSSDSERFGFWIAESVNDTSQKSILGWQSLLPCRSHPIFRSEWAESSTYVCQTTRVRGVGRALITHVTRNAAYAGLSHIVGYIREDNIAAMKIVEAAGWKRVGTVSCGDSPGKDRYYYVFPVVSAERPASALNPPRSNA